MWYRIWRSDSNRTQRQYYSGRDYCERSSKLLRKDRATYRLSLLLATCSDSIRKRIDMVIRSLIRRATPLATLILVTGSPTGFAQGINVDVSFTTNGVSEVFNIAPAWK